MDNQEKPKTIEEAIEFGKKQREIERMKVSEQNEIYRKKQLESQKEKDELQQRIDDKLRKRSEFIKQLRPSELLFNSYANELNCVDRDSPIFEKLLLEFTYKPNGINLFYSDVNAGNVPCNFLEWPKPLKGIRVEEFADDCPYGGYSCVFKKESPLYGWKLVGQNEWRFFFGPYRAFTIDLKPVGFFSKVFGRFF